MRSFVYLDEYKMYSLSSQLMEGVTDFVIKESKRSDSDIEEQDGPRNSGKKLAEIIETASANVEKRFLHDYAFSIFEEKLVVTEKVVSLTSLSSFSDLSEDVLGRRLVRIKAKANFLDAADILRSLNTLVDMQDALSIVANNDRREEIIVEMSELSSGAGKKGGLATLKAELDHLSKSQISREKSANDRLQYKHLSALLEHGFKRRLDLTMDLRDCKVTANLKRACLKDPEDFVFKTYSRIAGVELVLLGIATQYRTAADNSINEDADISPDATMGEMIANSTKALHVLENHFNRVPGNQIVVDPIALYLEL
ncbi:DUF6414 family protein [Pseudomonas violetae]|uniref:Uncharacterized protein n=1 Tax=Pseudomonas violetae TaxID=2915813 RepID=A0ABT0F8W7_9PSED|nr:hypothetical protein [Pseudomonas violetae]MCK1794294.1 hypothetical protein [Pseudomonas violetae]